MANKGTKDILEHFNSNNLLSRHLKRPEVKDQFVSIIEFAHNKGLDWYFTDIPDIRCGRKELESTRASAVCFRVWFKNLNELLIPAGINLGFHDTKLPLDSHDFSLLRRHIKKFATSNPAQRQHGGLVPDQYKVPGPDVFARDPLNDAISKMIKSMFRTVAESNGQKVLRIMKNKETPFTAEEAKNYVRKLFNSQDRLCAITGIKLQLPPNVSDHQLVCSLDRIDSNGQYAQDNLQVVCKFVNRWKSDTPDDEFRRLIELVKSQPY